MIASMKNHITTLKITVINVAFSRALRKFQVKLKMMTMSVLVIMMCSLPNPKECGDGGEKDVEG